MSHREHCEYFKSLICLSFRACCFIFWISVRFFFRIVFHLKYNKFIKLKYTTSLFIFITTLLGNTVNLELENYCLNFFK